MNSVLLPLGRYVVWPIGLTVCPTSRPPGKLKMSELVEPLLSKVEQWTTMQGCYVSSPMKPLSVIGPTHLVFCLTSSRCVEEISTRDWARVPDPGLKPVFFSIWTGWAFWYTQICTKNCRFWLNLYKNSPIFKRSGKIIKIIKIFLNI